MHGLAPGGEAATDGGARGEKTALLLLGHGSRAPGANEAMERVAAHFRRARPGWTVETAYLEINAPSIPEGIDLCAAAGARRVVVIPYFLHLGNHVGKDLPRLVAEGRARHPGVEIALGPHLGFHPKIIGIVEDRIGEALEGLGARGPETAGREHPLPAAPVG